MLITMRTVKATITSKNQLTIPAAFVRSMHLNRNQQVQVRQRGNDLILTPVPSLRDSLQPVWQEAAKNVSGSLSDEQIKAFVRQVAAKDKI